MTIRNLFLSFRRGVIPFAIYAMGLASLLLTDILITKNFAPNKISDWAEIRALIGVSGILCLCGLDQVLMRSRKSSEKIMKYLSFQIPLASLIVGFIVWAFGYVDRLYISVILVVGTSVSLVGFQYFRANGMAISSQISQQVWKVVLLVAIVISIVLKFNIDVDALSAGIMAFCALIIIASIVRSPPKSLYFQNPESGIRLYSIGSRFMAASLLLALAVYAEQLAVNSLGGVDEGAAYFTHAAYFLFPISIVNGYFAFVIGPWARDHADRFEDLVQNGRLRIFSLVLLMVVVTHAVGWVGWRVVKPLEGEPDYYLQGIFFICCWFRTMDTLPSSFNGIFGHERDHDAMIVKLILSLVLAILVSIFAEWVFNLSIIYSVAIFSLVNWILRYHFGFRTTCKIIESRYRGIA